LEILGQVIDSNRELLVNLLLWMVEALAQHGPGWQAMDWVANRVKAWVIPPMSILRVLFGISGLWVRAADFADGRG
jgi:hypothetical protein